MPTDDDDDEGAASDEEKRISIRVPVDTYNQIKSAAKRDHRSMAGWVKALIAKALEGTADTEPSQSSQPRPRPRKR